VEGTPIPSAQGPRWRLWVAIVAVALAAIFILQNSEETEVKFFFSTTETPLIFALLLAFGLGLVVGLVAPRFRRQDRHPRD
jgi:putative membrane protein